MQHEELVASLFAHQRAALEWMRAASLDPVEGKLQCFGCGARVGALRWAGSQCSCGTWVCPAVQLYRSALDEIAPHALLAQLAPPAAGAIASAAAAAGPAEAASVQVPPE